MTKPFSKLRDLLEKSTPGEWRAYDWPGFPRNDETIGGCVRIETKTAITAFCFAGEPNNDALLIAEAHNTLPKVLEEFDKLVDALGSAHATLEQIAKETRRPGLLACVDILDEALARIKELAGE